MRSRNSPRRPERERERGGGDNNMNVSFVLSGVKKEGGGGGSGNWKRSWQEYLGRQDKRIDCPDAS